MVKVCVYCESDATDEAVECEHCGASRFMHRCVRCGDIVEGLICPDCEAEEENNRKEREAEEDRRYKELLVAQEEAEERRDSRKGLVWKTVLTVFLPFVGAYFLLKPAVPVANRIFAIVWSSVVAIRVGMEPGTELSIQLASVILCLAPIIVYLIRMQVRKNDGRPGAPIWLWVVTVALVVFCVLLAIGS